MNKSIIKRDFVIKIENSFLCLFAIVVFTMLSSCKQAEKSDVFQHGENLNIERPNIVLIMTDQHQAEALSIAGNTDLKTPNLDKLAKTGVRFEKTYVTFPLCTPSRSSIFTGKLPHTLGVNSNKDGDNTMQNQDKQMWAWVMY